MSSWMNRAGRLAIVVSFGWSLPAVAEPPAQVAVSPPRLEIDLDGNSRTESLHVLNLSDVPTRVKVSVAHWDLDERNQVRVIPPTDQSLDQWLIVNPLEVTIAPHEQQTLRLAVRPRVAPAPGEHRAMIYIEQQPGSPVDVEKSGIAVRYRMGVAIYGYSGEIHRVGRVHGLTARLERDSVAVGLDVESTGNGYVRPEGQFGVWPRGAYPGDDSARAALLAGNDAPPVGSVASGRLPELPVLAGTRRTLEVRTERPVEKGAYVVAAAGSLQDEPFVLVAGLAIE